MRGQRDFFMDLVEAASLFHLCHKWLVKFRAQDELWQYADQTVKGKCCTPAHVRVALGRAGCSGPHGGHPNQRFTSSSLRCHALSGPKCNCASQGAGVAQPRGDPAHVIHLQLLTRIVRFAQQMLNGQLELQDTHSFGA